MLSIDQSNFQILEKIPNYNQKIIEYKDLFDERGIEALKTTRKKDLYKALSIGLASLTGKILYHTSKELPGICVCIYLQDEVISLRSSEGEKMSLSVSQGSVLIFGSIFRETWSFTIPKNTIVLHQLNPLEYIYLSTEQRLEYSKQIRTYLSPAKCLPKWQQNVHDMIRNVDTLGSGCYGYVYKGRILSACFAVKMSKIENKTEKDIDNNDGGWHEVYFLEKIIKPIIKNNICPNLPLLYDYFTCDNCNITLRKKEKVNTPCVISVMELASGDLKNYFSKNSPDDTEVLSILFQIMAALHAIQLYGQIMNFDVKKENILYYDVEPGGYWHYIVHGIDFYVPNYGKLFVLNDFGISRSLSPSFQVFREDCTTFRLGHRLAVIMNDKFVPFNYKSQIDMKGREIEPLKVSWSKSKGEKGEKGSKKKYSKGGQFRTLKNTKDIIAGEITISKKIKDYLLKKNIDPDPESIDFYMHPEIIPPFEFYNDTQDTIRMFVGGKRSTQKGTHKSCVSDIVYEKLKKYLCSGESMKDMKFDLDPACVCAGYFIKNFFGENEFFTSPLEDTIKLGSFKISEAI